MPESQRDTAWQSVHDAYMKVRGASCEEACEMVDVLMDPDAGKFFQALESWATDFEARTRTRSPNGKRTAC